MDDQYESELDTGPDSDARTYTREDRRGPPDILDITLVLAFFAFIGAVAYGFWG